MSRAVRPDRCRGLAVWTHPPAGDGTGRVVLVHGSLDRSAAFIRVARRLGDHEVVRYDRRGYGRSREAGVSATIEAGVDDLVAVLGDRPAAVVGHSLGGVVALAAAGRHPDLVTAAGAYEAPMAWAPWWPGGSAGSAALASDDPTRAAERFLRHLLGDEVWEGLSPRTRAERRAESPALLADLRAIRGGHAPYDTARLAAGMAEGRPVLLGVGGRSDAHHRRGVLELAAQLGRARTVEIEGAGHNAHTSHPDAFAAFVRAVTTGGDGDSPR